MPREINKPVVYGLLGLVVVVVLVVGFVVVRRMNVGRQIADHEAKLVAAREKGDVGTQKFEMLQLLSFRPNDQRLMEDYATLLEQTQEYGKAEAQWQKLVQMNPENISAHQKLAEFAQNRRDPNESARQAKEVLTRDPKNVRGHMVEGQSYAARGMLTEAAADMEQVIKLDPKNVQGYMELTRILLGLKDAKRAEEVMQEGLKAVPDNEQLQMFAGDWYRDHGDRDKAEAAYKAVLDVTKNKSGPLLQLALLYSIEGKQPEAEAKYVEAVKEAITPQEKVTALVSHGQYLASVQKPTEALAQYDAALKEFPDNPMLLSERADLLMRTGKLDATSGPENAEADITRLLQGHNEVLIKGLYLQGRLRMYRQDFDGALVSLSQALEESSHLATGTSTAQVRLTLAQCYMVKGDTAKSKELLAKLMEEYPDNWQVRYWLSMVLRGRGEYDKVISTLGGRKLPLEGNILLAQAHADKGDYEASRALLRGMRTAVPDELSVVLAQIWVELVAKEYKKMLDLTEEALGSKLIKTDAEKRTVYRQKITALRGLENYAEAEKVYKQMITEYPQDYETYRQYAFFLLAQNRYAEGETVLKDVMAKSDKAEVTDGYLAMYYRAAGKSAEARGEYRRLAEKYPKIAALREQLATMALADKDYAETRKNEDELRKLMPKSSLPDVIEGKALLGEKKFSEASKLLEEVVKKEPNNVEARYFLALAYISTGNPTGGVAQLEVVVNLAPRFRLAEELLASEYLQTGQVEKSDQMLKALKAQGNVAMSEEEEDRMSKIGSVVELSMGRPAEAEKKLKAYLAKNPEDGRSWLELGEAMFAQSRDAEEKGDKAVAKTMRDEAEKDYLTGWSKGETSSRAMFAIARFYLLTDRVAEAIKVTENATSEATSKPGPLKNDLVALSLLAQLYDQNGRQADGEKVYDRIAKIDPNNVLGLVSKAERLTKEGKLSEASAVFTEALGRSPKAVELRRRLVGSLVREQKYEQAGTVVEEGLKLAKDPAEKLSLSDMKASVLVNTKDAKGALALLKSAIEEADKAGLTAETAGPRFRMAELQIMMGDMAGAMKGLQQLEQIQPKFIDARVELLKLYIVDKREPEARMEALGLLQVQPVLPAYLTLGDMALNAGNYKEAISQYQAAVTKFPDSGMAKRGLGGALLLKGDKAAAMPVLREGLALSQYSSEELQNVTRLLLRANEGDEAMKILKDASSKSAPEAAEFLMGEVELTRGDVAKAVPHYEEAERVAPENMLYGARLGDAYLAKKDYAAAQKLAEGMLLKDNKSSAPYQILVATAEAQADTAGVEQGYQRWLKASPNNLMATNNYAYMLANQGKADQAVRLMEDLRAAKGTSQEYLANEAQLLDTEGWARYAKGDYTAAQRTLEKAKGMSQTPSTELLQHLGTVYVKLMNEATARGDKAEAKRYQDAAAATGRTYYETDVMDPEKQIQLAAVLAVEGKLDEAVERLKQAVAVSKGSERSRAALTEMLIREGRTDEAAKELAALRKTNPESSMAPVLEVMMLVRRAELMSQPQVTPQAKALLEQAQDLVNKSMAKSKDNGLIHYAQADLYLREGKLEEAKQSLDQTIRLMPDFAEVYMLKVQVLSAQGTKEKLEEAVATCETMLKRVPGNYPVQMNLGNLLLMLRRADEAEMRFRTMAESYPEAAGAHERLGYVLAAKGKREEALKEYKEALKRRPNDLGLLEATAGLNVQMDRAQQAADDVKAFVDKNKTNPAGHVLLAQVYERMGRNTDAEEEYQKAILAAPKDEPAYERLWELYMRLGRHELAAAQAQKMVDQNVAVAQAWQMQGQSYEVMQDWAKAEAVYRQGIAAAPNNIVGVNNLAWLMLEKTKPDPDEAIKIAEPVAKINDKFWRLEDTLGYAYFLKGDWEKAIPTLERAVELMRAEGDRSIQADVLMHSGMALMKGGKADLGKERVAEAVRRDPKVTVPDWVKEIMQRKS